MASTPSPTSFILPLSLENLQTTPFLATEYHIGSSIFNSSHSNVAVLEDGVLGDDAGGHPQAMFQSPAPLQDQPLLSLVEFHSDGEFLLSSLNNTDAWDEDGGVGCERNTLEAYAPTTTDYDGSTFSFGSSMKQMGEVLDDGREREVSCVGDISTVSGRFAQKQAKRERRQKAKAGDAEGAVAGSMSHSVLGRSKMVEILPPPAPVALSSTECRNSNEWVAPLINLTQKPVSSKRNDLRSGKRNLMSSWCNNVHTQQEENKLSSWIDHVPSTSTGALSPLASVVLSSTLGVGDNDYSQSVLSDSSSFVRGLRSVVGGSRAVSEQGGGSSTVVSAFANSDDDQEDAVSASDIEAMHPSNHRHHPNGRGVFDSPMALTRVVQVVTAGNDAPYHPPSAVDDGAEEKVGKAIVTSHHVSGTLPSLCFFDTSTLPPPSHGDHQQHHPATTTTRLRDAINAVQKYRVSGVDADESDTSANSMNSVSVSIPNVLSQHGATPLGNNAFVHINVEQAPMSQIYSTSSLNQNVSQLQSSSTNNMAIQNDWAASTPEASPAIESPCTFGIRTQPIPQPKSSNRKSAVSAVSLNECVYNLEHWDEAALGRFVVPTDNVADLEDAYVLHNQHSIESEVSPKATLAEEDEHHQSGTSPSLLPKSALPLLLPESGALLTSIATACSQPAAYTQVVTSLGSYSAENGEVEDDGGSTRLDSLVAFHPQTAYKTTNPAERLSSAEISTPTRYRNTNNCQHRNTSNSSAGGGSPQMRPSKRLMEGSVTFVPQTPIPTQESMSACNQSFPLNFPNVLTSPNNAMSTSLLMTPTLHRCASSSTTMRSASDVLAAFFSSSSGQQQDSSSGGICGSRSLSCGSPIHSQYRSVRFSTDASGCTSPVVENQRASTTSASRYGLLGDTLNGSFRGGGFSQGALRRSTSPLLLSPSTTCVDDEDDESINLQNQRVHRQFKSSLHRLQDRHSNTSRSGSHGSPILLSASTRRHSADTVTKSSPISAKHSMPLMVEATSRRRFSDITQIKTVHQTASTGDSPRSVTGQRSVLSLQSISEMYYFSDVVASYNVTVDTLTHGASNHTLQLAQPLTGDSARNYRRNEARMQQQSSSSSYPQQQASVQDD